jgi:hypothetical protein
VVTAADGSELFGDELEKALHGVIGYQKVLQVVQRRGHARDVVEALLDRDVRDRASSRRGGVEELADRVDHADPRRHGGEATRSTTPGAAVDDRSTRLLRASRDRRRLRASGEYRTLAASYAEIKDVVRAFRRVRSRSARRAQREDRRGEPLERDRGGGEAAPKPKGGGCGARTPPPRKDQGPVSIATLDELVEHFIALGRKGVASTATRASAR